MSGTTSAIAAGPRRITAIDVARALAVLGMLAIHLGLRSDGTPVGDIYNLPHGRASILFVLIAGVSIGLQTRNGALADLVRTKLVWVSIALLPIGLVLQALDHNVAVIIHHYAAFYLLGLCVAECRKRTILSLAAATTLIGPLAYFCGRLVSPDVFSRSAVGIGANGWDILSGLLISGPYPLLVWAGPLLWGLWIGRCDLRKQRMHLILLAAGIASTLGAAALSGWLGIWLGEPDGVTDWRALLIDAPHSQMPLWLIGSLGSAVAILATCLLLVKETGPLSAPLAALGQMALSFYVAHLLALHLLDDHLPASEFSNAIAALVAFSAAGLAFAVLWNRRIGTKGPLETVLMAPFALYHALSSDPARRHLDSADTKR